MTLSVFFQNKRQRNGHEKEKKNNFYASIYRKNKGGHIYTIIFLSIFFYFLCRRTKKRIIQINTHQQLAAHIFSELWIEVVGLDCYSHYINPIFCGQRFFSFFFLYYYCYYYVILNNIMMGCCWRGKPWELGSNKRLQYIITTLLMIDIIGRNRERKRNNKKIREWPIHIEQFIK